MEEEDDDDRHYLGYLPMIVFDDDKLVPNAKLLFALVSSLTKKRGYCWASNTKLGLLMKVDKDTISGWISQLSKSGYITITWQFPETKTNRWIFLSDQKVAMEVAISNASTPTTKIVPPYDENRTPPTTKIVPYKDNTNNKKNKVYSRLPLKFPITWTDGVFEKWDTLVQGPKWKSKPESALQLSVKKLSPYPVEFVEILIDEAIEGNWTGVVFPKRGTMQSTEEKFQEWKANQNTSDPSSRPGNWWMKHMV